MGESSIASFTVRWDDESMWGRSTVREGKRIFTIVAGVSQCRVRCLRQWWYILLEPQEMIASSLYMPCYIQRTIWVRRSDSKVKKVKKIGRGGKYFVPICSLTCLAFCSSCPRLSLCSPVDRIGGLPTKLILHHQVHNELDRRTNDEMKY